MHEMSITEDILRIVSEHAAGADATNVTEIQIVIGELASFIDNSIQFYFDILSPGTVAEGAILNFRRIKTRFRCRQCEKEFMPENKNWICPYCSALGGDIIAGKEFYIESITVSD